MVEHLATKAADVIENGPSAEELMVNMRLVAVYGAHDKINAPVSKEHKSWGLKEAYKYVKTVNDITQFILALNNE